MTPTAAAPAPGPALEALCFDVGGTLVEPAPPGTPIADLVPHLLPGVGQLLPALAAHFRLAAVTDTSLMREADVRRLLDQAGIGHHFDAVVTSVDAGAAKPDPASLREALRRLGVAPAAAVVVGDDEVDAGAAAAAGTEHVLVDPDRPLAAALLPPLARRLGPLAACRALIAPVDDGARAAAAEHQLRLTKPPGALGRLEDLGEQLSAIAGRCPPPLPAPATVAVFAGDHGVHAEDVSPWPQEVTAQMVANFVAGGAAINVLAAAAGAQVTVVDVGVATDLTAALPAGASTGRLRARRVRAGTANLAEGPAMSRADAEAAVEVGAAVAAELVADGARALVTGDMGIANTTPAAALIAALCGRPAAEVTGRGTGVDDPTLDRKVAIVDAAVRRARPGVARGDTGTGGALEPIAVLAEVGGLEHAALAGLVLGAAAARVPVVVDGVIALSGALVAAAMEPDTVGFMIAGHRSVEPGASVALDHLGLQPVIDLGLRLGEGTGAALALPVVTAAARVLHDMATFDSAGVSDTK